MSLLSKSNDYTDNLSQMPPYFKNETLAHKSSVNPVFVQTNDRQHLKILEYPSQSRRTVQK